MSVQFSSSNKHAGCVIMGAIAVLVVGFAVYLGHLYNQTFEPDITEQLRATSPDGRLDAVVYDCEGDATVGTSYFVVVVPCGSQDKEPVVYRIDRIKEDRKIGLSWRGHTLTIGSPRARAFERKRTCRVNKNDVVIEYVWN